MFLAITSCLVFPDGWLLKRITKEDAVPGFEPCARDRIREPHLLAPLRWPSGCANPPGHRSDHTRNIQALDEIPDKETLDTFPSASSDTRGKESGCCKSNGKPFTTRETDASRSKTKQKNHTLYQKPFCSASSVFLCVGKQRSRPSTS